VIPNPGLITDANAALASRPPGNDGASLRKTAAQTAREMQKKQRV
jgi:hypothetical protein